MAAPENSAPPEALARILEFLASASIPAEWQPKSGLVLARLESNTGGFTFMVHSLDRQGGVFTFDNQNRPRLPLNGSGRIDHDRLAVREGDIEEHLRKMLRLFHDIEGHKARALNALVHAAANSNSGIHEDCERLASLSEMDHLIEDAPEFGRLPQTRIEGRE